MKIFTERKRLLELLDIPFSYETFAMLIRFALSAPNVTLDAREVHTGKRIRVKLFELSYEWEEIRDVNIP